MSDQEAWDAATAPLSDELPRPEPEKEKPAKAEPKAKAEAKPETEEAVAPDHDDGTEDDSTEEDGKKPAKPGKWMRKALKSEAEVELLRKELEAVRAKPVEPPKPAEAQKPAEGEPKLEDHETYEDFMVAKTEWRLEQKAKAKEAEASQVKAKSDHDTWIEAAKAKYEDFEEVALSKDIPIADPTVIAIKESEHGADIAYYLGQNPDEAKRISQLSPLGQAKAIGKLEARFEKEAEAEEKPAAPPPPKKATTAPKPPSRVSGRGNAEPAPEKMGNAEYRAWRAAGGGKA